MSNKEEVEFEAYDAQGNAHLVDVDEVCDESPTTQGSVPEEVGTTGTVKPKPPSEPGGSEQEGKGGRKGRSHGTWASLTPERMPEEDFKALRHPWAPWSVFTEKKQEESTATLVIPGEEKADNDLGPIPFFWRTLEERKCSRRNGSSYSMEAGEDS